MAEISAQAVRALTDRQTDRQTDRHTDKHTTVTLFRMRRGLIPIPPIVLVSHAGVCVKGHSL